jgi:hypothetical protein
MEKKRARVPRKILLAATAGLASVTLNGCNITSGNLIAPPPCDDAGNYECFDAGPEDTETDAGSTENTGDAGEADDAGDE